MKKGKNPGIGVLFRILGLVIIMLFLTGTAAAGETVLTLRVRDAELEGPAALRGSKIGNIGKNGGEKEGTVLFRDLALPADGYYTLRVSYYSGSDDRYFDLTAEGETLRLPCPSTGGFDRKGTVDIDLRLSAGGSLKIGSDWYGPDLGDIEILLPEAEEFPSRTYENRREERFGDGPLVLVLDDANGIWGLEIDGDRTLSDARAEAVTNGMTVASHDFAGHRIESDGNRVTFRHENHPTFGGTLTQTFELKPGEPYLLTEVTLAAEDGVATNRIAPLAVYEGGIRMGDGVFLRIPFDNDMWAEPEFLKTEKLGRETVSYEAGALYDAPTGAGLVTGSVEHGVWKTGVRAEAWQGSVKSFSVFGGAADAGTHDTSPHGTLSGSSVKSPRIFVGWYGDWRDGLTAYGAANAEAVPPKQSSPSVPFGYNSWGVLQDKVKYSDMTAASDYIRDRFGALWAGDGEVVYINIDSFWDYMAANDPACGMTRDEALRAFVKHCRDNGQKAGIYFTPFAAWHGDEASLRRSRVEGTEWTYYDAALKKSDGGELYGKLDGGFALDPTHPATLTRLERQLRAFIEMGFEYVKLDFMTHGALEGQHWDPAVRTGLEAYAVGMAKIREICGEKLFVNLSIAPLFPYQYADGRRISCDAFSSLDNTRHVLSCLTAGFWEEEIYPYPDPDHLVVWGKDGKVAEGEARCRVTAGAISGTSFLIGDSLTDAAENPDKDRRLTEMFGNPDVIAAAKLGRCFRPWKVIPGEKCADAFWCAEDGVLWLAVFNFGETEREESFDLAEKLPAGEYACREAWRGTEPVPAGDVLVCRIPPRDAALYRISIVREQPSAEETAAAEPEETPESPAVPVETDRGPDGKAEGVSSSRRGILIGAAALAVLGAAAASAAAILHRRKK